LVPTNGTYTTTGLEQCPKLEVHEVSFAETRDKGVIISRQRHRISQGDTKLMLAGLDARRREKEPFHLGQHTWNAFTLVAHDAEVDEHAHCAWVPAGMNASQREQVFKTAIRNETAWPGDLEPVIKEPDIGGATLDIVISMRSGIDDCLLPRKCRLFGPSAKAMPYQARWLAHKAFNRAKYLFDGLHRGRERA
jgi:hypothetical protein